MSKYKFSKTIGKEIPDSEATKWIDLYKKKHKDQIHAYFFGSDIIHKILKNPEAVGLRVFLGYSIDEETKKRKTSNGIDRSTRRWKQHLVRHLR